MKGYTITLTSPKIKIPSDGIEEFIKDLIISNLLNIDYFGYEIDNQLDYTDKDLGSFIESTSFITLNFDSAEFDPDHLTELEKFQFVINLLTDRSEMEIHCDEKDITINL